MTGTVVLGRPRHLDVPPEVTSIGVIPLGYPDRGVPSPSLKRGRQPLHAVVHRERW